MLKTRKKCGEKVKNAADAAYMRQFGHPDYDS
jgi:hypothetical protein